MKNRLGSILLTLAMVLTLMPSAAMPALAAELGRIYATITLPVADMHPVFEGISGNESKYTVTSVSFRRESGSSDLTSNDIFVSGVTYRIYVRVLPTGDYAAQKAAFSESTTAKVNGLDAAYCSTVDNGTSVLYVFSLEYTVRDASVTVTLPVADEHPVFEGISGNESKYSILGVSFQNVKGSVDMKSTDTFVGGETYRIYVRVLPTGDYAAQKAAFSESSMAKVNGLDAAYWSKLDNGSSAFYIFSLEYTVPINSGTCGENLTWRLKGGTLTVSGTGNMTSAPWSTRKNEIEAVVIKPGVTSIYKSAFNGCPNLAYAVIPASVTSIGQWALKSNSLKDVYYSGTKTQWDNISGIDNANLPSGAAVHYQTTSQYPEIFTEKRGEWVDYFVQNVPAGARLIVARYSEGRMMECYAHSFGKAVDYQEVNSIKPASGEEYKLMLVNKDFAPLCAAAEVNKG